MSRTPSGLRPDEAALWARVIESVRPLKAPTPTAPPAPASAPSASPAAKTPPAPPAARGARTAQAQRPRAVPPVRKLSEPAPPPPANTLDGGWDRRLSRGLVSPESAIDLHGHTLATAYDRLDRGLEAAIARGDRVLLLVTGRAPRADAERPYARGAIRAAVNDWLAASRHAGRIAAVRGAHPRHGGAGALYIVLRRPRGATARDS